MVESTRGRVAETQDPDFVQGVRLEVVVEGAVLAELGDEPELHLHPHVLAVRGHIAEDIGVPQEAGLVDVHLVVPRDLLPGVEYLHCHAVPLVGSPPHLPKPPLPHQLLEDNLGGYGLLGEEGETRATPPGVLAAVVDAHVQRRGVAVGVASASLGGGGDPQVSCLVGRWEEPWVEAEHQEGQQEGGHHDDGDREGSHEGDHVGGKGQSIEGGGCGL